MPNPLDGLPVEVVELVRAVDRMRDSWAECEDAQDPYACKVQLWKNVHGASDAVRARDLENPHLYYSNPKDPRADHRNKPGATHA